MTKETERSINILKTAILENVPVVEKIYLFGSQAYGTPNTASDIDVFIIIPNVDWDTIEMEVNIRTAVFHQKAFNYDMLFETTGTFEKRKNSFELENKVYTQGILVYERGR